MIKKYTSLDKIISYYKILLILILNK